MVNKAVITASDTAKSSTVHAIRSGGKLAMQVMAQARETGADHQRHQQEKTATQNHRERQQPILDELKDAASRDFFRRARWC